MVSLTKKTKTRDLQPQNQKPIMNKKLKTVLFALFASSFAFSVSQAQVIFSETFESYQVDQTLNAKNPGDGNSNNWSVVVSDTRGALSVAGASTGGMGANQMVGHYFKEVAGDTVPTLMRDFAPQSTGILETTFKLKIGANHDKIQAITLRGADGVVSSVTALRFRFGPTSFAAHYGPTDITTLMSNVIKGDWYQVTFNVNIDAQTFSIAISNLDKPADPGQSVVSDEFGFYDSRAESIFRWSAEAASGTAIIDASFDDIVITSVIPEPSTYALLFGSAVLGLVLIRRRRARS